MPLTVKEFIEKKEQEFENDRRCKKEILIEDADGNLCCVNRDSWIFIRKSDKYGHVFCLERMKVIRNGMGKSRTKLEEGGYVYRSGYFVIGKKEAFISKITRMENNFIWEGYAPPILQKDFQKIVRGAIKNGLIKPHFIIPPPF